MKLLKKDKSKTEMKYLIGQAIGAVKSDKTIDDGDKREIIRLLMDISSGISYEYVVAGGLEK